MKIISAKNILAICMSVLVVYSVSVYTGFFSYSIFAEIKNSNIIALNLVTVLLTYLLLKVIDVTTRKKKLDTDKNKTLIEFCKSVLVFIAIILVMQNLGYNFNALLAIGGAGSLIIGLAAKDLISNIFGYITIILDRSFTVGDAISCEQHKIAGTVKKIGLRTTELTRVDKKPVYVPNSVWTTTSIVNSSRKTNREVDVKIPLLCSDSRKLQEMNSEIRNQVKNYAALDINYSVNVFTDCIDNYGAHLRVLLYLKNININEYYEIKEKIIYEVISIAKQHDVNVNILTSM